MKHFCFGAFALWVASIACASEPSLIADFEGADYEGWKATGEAFGKGPAQGTLPGQMHVDGFSGNGLVNTFLGGDDAVGTLTSPPIQLKNRFITFLIGGGGWAGETCMNLMVDGKVVQSVTGKHTTSGNTERLEPMAWDVGEYVGREITLVIVDQRKGGWGHINVDHIVQTNDRGTIPLAPTPIPLIKDASLELVANKKWLSLPVKNGGAGRVVTVKSGDEIVARIDIELADDQPDWWAPMDISHWSGSTLKVSVNTLPENSKALKTLHLADKPEQPPQLYREPLRSQFHYSSKQGWVNDPNGLVYYQGEYHLFYQHNPYGWNWGNMHWGHATSKDLVHWKEHGDVLAPDRLGAMFSGSAVVDWNNTSGFGTKNDPPLVLIYTAAGDPTTQCIAYSNDGRSFTKYKGNPVIPQISGGNRDPKVMWHEPSKQWIMVLYVEAAGKQHTVHFFTSPNLREWKVSQVVNGGVDGDKYLFECPDFFELPVDGNSANRKWVLNAADSAYAIGTFDGKSFVPETSRLVDVRGRGFYAAQTFSDVPDGRRIQIGWCQAPSPGMAFNQLQSIPCELSLRSTPDGIRLARTPVKELASLRSGTNMANSLPNFRSELIELRAEFEPIENKSVEFEIRGITIGYDASKQELRVNDLRAPAPLIDGKQSLTIFVDKTIVEVIASDGLTYIPMPFIPKAEDQAVTIRNGENVKMKSLQVYSLGSSWQ